MTSWLPKVRAAACNVAPVFLDTAKTVRKATSLIKEAANNRADIVVFPETYIPAYPLWASLTAPIDNHSLFSRLARESILIDGPEVAALQNACLSSKIYAHIGFNERSKASLGCLWNSSILIDDRGQILNHHRKIVPTFYEKLIWAPGDGAGLRVIDTERCGKIGGLICGENTNPLARWSLIAQGEQVHISTWPAVSPMKRAANAEDKGTGGAGKQYDNVGATRIRSAAHCFEAKCFGIVCSGFMDRDMRDAIVKHDPAAADTVESASQGASFFLDPTGAQIGDQVQGEEGMAYADLDLDACVEPKQFHDVVGGYQRFDIFDLRVQRKRLGPETAFEAAENSDIATLTQDDVGRQ